MVVYTGREGKTVKGRGKDIGKEIEEWAKIEERVGGIKENKSRGGRK